MKNITIHQFLFLNKLGEKLKCPYYLPPFQKRFNTFFDVTGIKSNIKNKLIKELDDSKIKYKFHSIKNRKFLEIFGEKI